MADTTGRAHRRYRKDNARLKRTMDPICWICGEEIDLNLPPNHPKAWTSDHIIPLAEGGSLYGERRPCCRSCNARKGGKSLQPGKPTNTEPW